MFFKYLCLNNFRLFPYAKLEFTSDMNIVLGMNGRGKTTILEAIHYLSLTRSFRVSDDSTAIKIHSDFFDISAEVYLEPADKNDVRIYYSSERGKNFFMNGKKVITFAEVIGLIPCVVFTLADLKLVFGSPGDRRRYIDIVLAQTSSIYLENLKFYRRALQQKNALLNSTDRKLDRNQLQIWNQQLLYYGTPIVLKRLEYIDFLNQQLTRYYSRFNQQEVPIKIIYKTNIYKQENSDDRKHLEETFRNRLTKLLDSEYDKRTSLIGPHRDDMEIILAGKPVRYYCSQGESKLLALSLKFAEWWYLMLNKGKKPIILLDDVFSELDHSKHQVILNFVKEMGQSFITTTDKMEVIRDLTANKYVLDDEGIHTVQ